MPGNVPNTTLLPIRVPIMHDYEERYRGAGQVYLIFTDNRTAITVIHQRLCLLSKSYHLSQQRAPCEHLFLAPEKCWALPTLMTQAVIQLLYLIIRHLVYSIYSYGYLFIYFLYYIVRMLGLSIMLVLQNHITR